MIRAEDLLHPTPAGLYCPPGDFYVDPVRPVDRAVITHGHSDHARAGHGAVLATRQTLAIMAERYGADSTGQAQSVEYGQATGINGVDLRLAPAGHVLGSAQVEVRCKGLTMVVSGDYKRRRDPTCAPFEPIPCHVFISEATFGLPVFSHPPAEEEVGRLVRVRWLSSRNGRIWSAPMRWARRNGSFACCVRRGGSDPSIITARWSG